MELCLARTATHRPPAGSGLIFINWESGMKRTFVLDSAGVHTGVRFDFGAGRVYDIRITDLTPAVRAHATCNGIGEALRDTGAGKSDAEAIAAFEKRLDVLMGGSYSARGGSRLDWAADILEAIGALLAKAGKELNDTQKVYLKDELETVGKDGTDGYKKWLAANPTRKAIGKMVDSIRKERAAARAKERTTDIDVGSIF